MLGEFVHQARIYCIKSVLDPVTPDEHEIKFKNLKDAKHFFAYVASDPFSREELLEVAQWLRPTSCRPRKNCPKPTEQELLDMLCLVVCEDGIRGDYRLVELKPPKPALKFEECCVGSIKHIERIVDNTRLLGPVLCIAQAVQILASHTRTPDIISTLSAAYNATQTNWEMLAGAMASLSDVQRKSIIKIAQNEFFKHNEKEMNRELGKYWKGIMDATA
jgi:hypothetical protein